MQNSSKPKPIGSIPDLFAFFLFRINIYGGSNQNCLSEAILVRSTIFVLPRNFKTQESHSQNSEYLQLILGANSVAKTVGKT